MLCDLLFDDLVDYLNVSPEAVRDRLTVSHQAVVDHWNSSKPKDDVSEEEFYKTTDTYLLELAAWILDFPGRTQWNESVSAFVDEMKLATALDFGCGIANEGLQLASQGLKVDLCDISEHSLRFAKWRADKHQLKDVRVINAIDPGRTYDFINMIDVIGHIANPTEIILDLAKVGKYLFYTEDFQLPPPQNYWPMHRDKPANFDRAMKGVWKDLGYGFYESLVFKPKFSIVPTLQEMSKGEGGVRRQIEALSQELPKHGIEIDPTRNGFFGHTHATALHPRTLVYTSHGFYPWDTKDAGEVQVNTLLKSNIGAAKGIISVSDEAKEIIEDKLSKTVHLIRNGVFLDQLDKVESGISASMDLKQPYFLWSKNTIKGVCDPTPSLELARKMPQYQFVFTQVNTMALPPNVKVIGNLPYDKMLRVIKDCAVYLGTTKEQFSVQTLEAMAMQKPVLCFPEGGNAKVVSHKKSGYIATDPNDLVVGAKMCLENSQKWGAAGRDTVKNSYRWEAIVSDVAKVYYQAIDEYIEELKRPLVSVIIPHYNLWQYIEETIDSVLAQTLQDKEVIVVDDGSKDTVAWERLKSKYKDQSIKFLAKLNTGVSDTRNYGIRQSTGKYICCLDADDRIHPKFLERLTEVAESNWSIGIAYCDFELFDQAKGTIRTADYDFERLKQGNFIPCCNVFRRSAWEAAGGYKDINPSWEDYELWLNMGKLGYYGARVKETLFYYRKKGNEGRDYESHPFAERLRGIVNSFHPDLYPPQVSVIIPTYKQTHYLPEALESLEKQTFRDFEVIVVDDGNSDKNGVQKAVGKFAGRLPVKVIRHPKNLGLATARNTGVKASRGKYVLTLDSDDLLKPTFLQTTVAILEDRPDISIAYTDVELFGAADKVLEMPEYNFNELLTHNLLACTSLYRRQVFEAVGGYSTDMIYGWEDYDFWIRAGRLGYCGVRWAEPLFRYRRYDGSMLMRSRPHVDEMRKQLRLHSPDVFRGEKPMGCCGRTSLTAKPGATKKSFVSLSGKAQGGEYPLVSLVYKGNAPLTIRGSVTPTFYKAQDRGQIVFVDPRDAVQLVSRGDFVYEVDTVSVPVS